MARTDPNQRAEALESYAEYGLAESARRTGVPKTTLRRWAREEGMDTAALAGADVDRTSAATAARTARCDLMRSELRELLLEKAVGLLERMDEPHIDFRGQLANKVEFDNAPADACRNYAVAAAVLVDKYRLEMGEATARTEHDDVPIEERVARVMDKRQRLRTVRDTAA